MSFAIPREWALARWFIVTVVFLGCTASVTYAFLNREASRSLPAVATPVPKSVRSIGLPRFGIDYYRPNSYGSVCSDWTWLETRCFDPGQPPSSAGEPGRTVLRSDLDFIRAAGIGHFIRVWLSADQLIRFSGESKFAGLRSSRLRNLDQALSIAAASRLRVDLVLFSYSASPPAQNQFDPAALDGRHPGLRSAYLAAVKAIIGHIAANATDERTVRVIDLQNEAYYQLEQYFSTASHLGLYSRCQTSSGNVSLQCVDQAIVHPWLTALYLKARSASHRFLYTVSDTGRLLTTTPSQQRYWIRMYPVDVYDIHMYDNQPWLERARWSTALNLRKPWFSGEIGCASGNVSCTYNGSNAARVDSWWLRNLPSYGAQAMLLEEGYPTVWTYRAANPSQALTLTGHVLRCEVPGTHYSCPALP